MYSYYAILYRNLRKAGVAVESTCYYAESEEAAHKLLIADLHRVDRGFSIEVLATVKVDE
ncbi:MAG: hypothetical protein IKJ99_03250 [Oscillospiraceae bacterium]|nr:hypothetical protein [Oscillospiraceae bacterium]